MDTKRAGRIVSILKKIWATERCEIWQGKWREWMDLRDLKGSIDKTWCQTECRGGGRGEIVSRMAFEALSWSAEWIMVHRLIKELGNQTGFRVLIYKVF